jgi:hypothetical protein
MTSDPCERCGGKRASDTYIKAEDSKYNTLIDQILWLCTPCRKELAKYIKNFLKVGLVCIKCLGKRT